MVMAFVLLASTSACGILVELMLHAASAAVPLDCGQLLFGFYYTRFFLALFSPPVHTHKCVCTVFLLCQVSRSVSVSRWGVGILRTSKWTLYQA